MVRLTADGVEFSDFSGNIIIKETGSFQIEDTASGTEGYPHFMLKEIFEEPNVLSRTVRNGCIFKRR